MVYADTNSICRKWQILKKSLIRSSQVGRYANSWEKAFDFSEVETSYILSLTMMGSIIEKSRQPVDKNDKQVNKNSGTDSERV